jgi:hypothetical protein
MNTKNVISIGLVLGILGIMVGVYYAGKVAKQNEILAQPARVDTVQLPPVFITAKPETLYATATLGVIPHFVRASLAGRDSSGIVALVDSLERKIDTLSAPVTGTLTDSLGGMHRITYLPTEQRFIEDFRATRKVETVQITVTRFVPIEKPWWYLPAAVLAGGVVVYAVRR